MCRFIRGCKVLGFCPPCAGSMPGFPSGGPSERRDSRFGVMRDARPWNHFTNFLTLDGLVLLDRWFRRRDAPPQETGEMRVDPGRFAGELDSRSIGMRFAGVWCTIALVRPTELFVHRWRPSEGRRHTLPSPGVMNVVVKETGHA